MEKIKSSIESKKVESQFYQDDLNSRTSELQALEESIETAFKERQDSRQTHASNQRSLDEIKTHMQDVQNRLGTLNSSVDEIQEQYNKVVQDVSERQREIDHFNGRQVEIEKEWRRVLSFQLFLQDAM